MSITAFNEKESLPVGTYRVYPATLAMYHAFGIQIPETEPKYDRPISPKENMKRVLNGEIPYWLPFGGMNTPDITCFFPRQVPDNYVAHLVQDGGEETPEYPSLSLPSNWFDLEWEYVPSAGGATVHPGNPKILDMSEWEKYVKIPCADDLDWDAIREMNKDYLDTDRFNMLNVLNGPWERLMSLMDVSGAAMALVDEDQEEGLLRFFDQYSDFWAEFITRMAQNCNIDGILMHDDWGHQNGPFFSIDTARKFLLPSLKKIVKACHDNGLFYEQHSCGQNAAFIELYIEAGVNLYCPQDINDFDVICEKAKGSSLVIGVPIPILAPDASTEQVEEAAREWWNHYKGYRIVSSFLFPNPAFNEVIYRLSRNTYAEQ